MSATQTLGVTKIGETQLLQIFASDYPRAGTGVTVSADQNLKLGSVLTNNADGTVSLITAGKPVYAILAEDLKVGEVGAAWITGKFLARALTVGEGNVEDFVSEARLNGILISDDTNFAPAPSGDLTNMQHAWEVGVEIDLGDGTFGMRFVGNLPNTADPQFINLAAVSTGVDIGFRLVSTGGWVAVMSSSPGGGGTNYNCVSSGIVASISVGFGMGINNISMRLEALPSTPPATSSYRNYDVWVRYTKGV